MRAVRRMSKEKPDAWMPLYIGDWEGDTGHLTNEQDGAYGRLVRWYWRNGPLPDKDAVLASIIRADGRTWKRLRGDLAAFFVIADGAWRHKRIDAELVRWSEKKASASAKAEAAARARWEKENPNGPRGGHASSNAPSNAPSIRQAMLEQCPSPSSTVERASKKALSHSGRDAPLSPRESEAGSAPRWPGPADIREVVVARMGESYAVSWLDQCAWQDVPERLIVTPTSLCADRLWRDLRREFAEREISVGKRAAA